MRILIVFFVQFFFFAAKLNAQRLSGARNMAMANTGTAQKGIYSLGSNQAGIVSLKKPTLAFAFQEQFYSADVRKIAAFFAFPTRIGVFGFYADRYSFKQNYIEYQGGLTLSHLFASKFTVGGTLSYHQNLILQYGLNKAISFDLGFQYESSPDWIIGIHFTNLHVLTKINEVSYEIPSQIKIGTSHNLSDQILFAIESEYDFKNHYDFMLGVEYLITDKVNLRGGISIIPFKQYTGAGVYFNKLNIDAAISFHPQLGLSSQLSLNYAF